MTSVGVTMLNSMAAESFEESLDRHVEWGLSHLDLKESIFGKLTTELNDSECERAVDLIASKGLSVHCLSTPLFSGVVESRQDFTRHVDMTEDVLRIAAAMKPDMVRVLAPQTDCRSEHDNAVAYVRRAHGWLFDMYRSVIARLSDAGLTVTIENSPAGCILSKPDEVQAFFDILDAGSAAQFTWDVQNMWDAGTFPSLDVYERLRPYMGYYHVKGGQSATGGVGPLYWNSSLEDATWPVEAITHRVIADGATKFICLNPSHGRGKPGYDYGSVLLRDLRFIREVVERASPT